VNCAEKQNFKRSLESKGRTGSLGWGDSRKFNLFISSLSRALATSELLPSQLLQKTFTKVLGSVMARRSRLG
jgi:hypothetical protein